MKNTSLILTPEQHEGIRKHREEQQKIINKVKEDWNKKESEKFKKHGKK